MKNNALGNTNGFINPHLGSTAIAHQTILVFNRVIDDNSSEEMFWKLYLGDEDEINDSTE